MSGPERSPARKMFPKRKLDESRSGSESQRDEAGAKKKKEEEEEEQGQQKKRPRVESSSSSSTGRPPILPESHSVESASDAPNGE